jgi:hypothetical protein
LLAILTLAVTTARAQSRPLATQDPEPVGAGRVAIDFGVASWRDAVYPVSGLKGDLVQLGTFNMNFGISSMADVTLDGGIHNRLSITSRDPSAPDAALVATTGTSTGDVEDVVIGTRIRFKPEEGRRPSFGARFTTRLPNAKHESGLGLDTMDFALSILTGKTIGAVRIVGNVGWSILEDPVTVGIQNDVVTYGGSVAFAMSTNAAIVGEVNGRADTRHGTPPLGTESRTVARAGTRYTFGSTRFDAAVQLGLTRHDPSWGLTAGVTWIFTAFRVP